MEKNTRSTYRHRDTHGGKDRNSINTQSWKSYYKGKGPRRKRKMSRQRDMKQTKASKQNPSKFSLILFYVSYLLLDTRFALNCCLISSEIPLDKINFSFMSIYPLEIVSGLGRRAYVYLLLSAGTLCLRPVQALCILPISVSLCKYHFYFV